MKNAVDWNLDDSDDSEKQVKRRHTIKECSRDRQAYLLKKRADLIFWKLQKDKLKVRGFKSQTTTPLKNALAGLPQSKSTNILGDLLNELRIEDDGEEFLKRQSLNNTFDEGTLVHGTKKRRQSFTQGQD